MLECVRKHNCTKVQLGIGGMITMSNEISSSNSPLKSRVWELELYEDCERHREELKQIMTDIRCVGAYHDKDLKEDGTLKKPHYHCYYFFDNASSIGSVLKIFPNHEVNLIRSVKSVKGACRYLLHLDNPEKFQYTEDSLIGNIKLCKKYLKTDDYECEGIQKIITYIESFDSKVFDSTVLWWCCQENLYSVYRRHAYIFSRIIDQHNHNIFKYGEKNDLHDLY